MLFYQRLPEGHDRTAVVKREPKLFIERAGGLVRLVRPQNQGALTSILGKA
jgi:hypothetical protein